MSARDSVWLWWPQHSDSGPRWFKLALHVYWWPEEAPRWTRLWLDVDWDYRTRVSVPLGIPRRWLYDEATFVYTFLRIRCQICGRDRWAWRRCVCPYRRAGI